MLMIKTRVGPSSIHGTGVFACEAVPLGGLVWQYEPAFDRVISADAAAAAPLAVREFLAMYAYPSDDLDGQLVLSGDHARFLNHSDDPNTSELPFKSVASRPIAIDDEITCDYGAFCTGWTGFDLHEEKKALPLPHRNLYTRLKASRDGVGVFAIRDIPEGTDLFAGDTGAIVRVPVAVVDAISDRGIREIYRDFCPVVDGAYLAPTDFNRMTIGWFPNHSETPNVTVRDMQFVTNRFVREGEELRTDYRTYSESAAPRSAE